MIVEELLDSARRDLRSRRAVDVRIGLGYTGVMLDDGSMGLAYTFRDELTECCQFMDEAGNLEGNAYNLAELILSPFSIHSSLGLATINAVLNRDVKGVEGDLLDHLEMRKGDKVGMVGDFRPLFKDLEGVEIKVFERRRSDDSVYPDWAAEQMLPKVDVAIISGTAIINKTMDHLLDLCKSARTVAVMGPSTPLSPLLGEKGADLLGGIVVDRPKEAMRIISQGGGTRSLADTIRKITVDLNQ
ncbi:MAG: Rossmann-like domain-containing protein [Methanomassiliicoccales archaeon]